MTVQILTDVQKRKIVKMIDKGYTQKTVANEFNTSDRTIRRVLAEMRGDEIVRSVPVDQPPIVDYQEEDTKWEYTVIAAKNSISITRSGIESIETEAITPDAPLWAKIKQVVWDGQGSHESLEKAFILMNDKHIMKQLSNGKISVDIDLGSIVYKDGDVTIPLSSRLKNRIMTSLQNSESIDKYCRFAEHLLENPSNSVVERLYDFIEANDILITDEGHVECWKRIRHNYTDIHSGTMLNKVGTTVSVRRNQVDENLDRTCSYGLHVCSKSYLDSFGGDRTVKCIVNPRDFVAIPRDYDNAKARVCEYYVDREVSNV